VLPFSFLLVIQQPEETKKDEGSANESEEVDKTSAEVVPAEETPVEAPVEAQVETNMEEPVPKKIRMEEPVPEETRLEEPVPEVPEAPRVNINVKTQSETTTVSVGPDATVAEVGSILSSKDMCYILVRCLLTDVCSHICLDLENSTQHIQFEILTLIFNSPVIVSPAYLHSCRPYVSLSLHSLVAPLVRADTTECRDFAFVDPSG